VLLYTSITQHCHIVICDLSHMHYLSLTFHTIFKVNTIMNVHPANSREEYRQVLVRFIGALKGKEPWWHAILGRVDAHDTTRSLPEMIGISKETALSVFEGAGLALCTLLQLSKS
jgi:hypothetical protein